MKDSLREFLAKELKEYRRTLGEDHSYNLDANKRTTIGELIEDFEEEFDPLANY